MPSWKAPDRAIVTPLIIVPEAMLVIAFAENVFGATLVRKPLLRADGSLWNAEIDIGGSTIMLAAPDPAAPMTQTAFVYVQVEDADATFQRAIEAGATAMMAPQDQFYGDRDGGVQDLSGNIWWISTHKDDLSDDEIERGARALEAQKAGEA